MHSLFLILLLSAAAAPVTAAASPLDDLAQDDALTQDTERRDDGGLDNLSAVPSWADGSQKATPDGEVVEMAAAAPPTPGPPATPVPVDGGLSLLALAGAGYAVRRLRGTAPGRRPRDP